MPRYVALLRAVNVGGTGKLPMAELRAMCAAESFAHVQTFIASGNVVFVAKQSESKVKAALEKRLHAYAGKHVGVVVRTVDEMIAILAANPFQAAPRNSTVAIFLDKPPPPDALENVRGQKDEVIGVGIRELYVAYGPDMGRSKLRIVAAKAGTARNINTIMNLVELAAALPA